MKIFSIITSENESVCLSEMNLMLSKLISGVFVIVRIRINTSGWKSGRAIAKVWIMLFSIGLSQIVEFEWFRIAFFSAFRRSHAIFNSNNNSISGNWGFYQIADDKKAAAAAAAVAARNSALPTSCHMLNANEMAKVSVVLSHPHKLTCFARSLATAFELYIFSISFSISTPFVNNSY